MLIGKAQTAEPLEHAPRLVDLGPDGRRLTARLVEMALHDGDGRLAGLVGAVLVEDVVHVDEEGAEVGDLGLGVRGHARQDAGELEEVEQQRFGESLELEGAVVVLGVLVWS